MLYVNSISTKNIFLKESDIGMKQYLTLHHFQLLTPKNLINPSIAGKQTSKEGKREGGGGKEEKGGREEREREGLMWGGFTNTQQVLFPNQEEPHHRRTAAAPPAQSPQLCCLLGWERGGWGHPHQIPPPPPQNPTRKHSEEIEAQKSQGSPFRPSFLKQTWARANLIPLRKCVLEAPPCFWAHCHLSKGKQEDGDYKPLPVSGGLLPTTWTMPLVLDCPSGSRAKWRVCTMTQPHPWSDRNAKQSGCQKKHHPWTGEAGVTPSRIHCFFSHLLGWMFFLGFLACSGVPLPQEHYRD